MQVYKSKIKQSLKIICLKPTKAKIKTSNLNEAGVNFAKNENEEFCPEEQPKIKPRFRPTFFVSF